MKNLKKVLLFLAALVLVFVIAGFFLPAQISLERSRIIDAPIQMVYDQVNNLHEWEYWSPWHQIDTSMGITYANHGIGKGASYSWTSDHKQVGNGTMTITEAKTFEFIDTEMDFGENGMGTAGFKFTEEDGKTLLSWDMRSEAGSGPIARWIGLLMKSMIQKSYDQGLEALDARCQELKNGDWYFVDLKDKDEWLYYSISSEQVTMKTMDAVMTASYGKIGRGMAKVGIESLGAPFAIYHSWGMAYDMECAIRVEDNSTELKGIERKRLLAQKYAVLKYKGAFDGLENAHEYLMNWLENNNLELAGSVIEVYKTDPNSEPDPEKWVTYILYPVQ